MAETHKGYRKYSNKKKVVDGIKFDSKAEANYYCELKLRKQAGEIKDFRCQPSFELVPAFTKNGKKFRPVKYVADFEIVHNDGSLEIVDVKGMATQLFLLKEKLFHYRYPELHLTIHK